LTVPVGISSFSKATYRVTIHAIEIQLDDVLWEKPAGAFRKAQRLIEPLPVYTLDQRITRR
jgi:hypothetical protein